MAKTTWPSPFLLMLPGLCPEPLLALHLASPWIVLLELAWFLPLSMVCPAHLCTSPSLNGNLSIVCISSLLAPDHMSLTLADSSSCFLLPPGKTIPCWQYHTRGWLQQPLLQTPSSMALPVPGHFALASSIVCFSFRTLKAFLHISLQTKHHECVLNTPHITHRSLRLISPQTPSFYNDHLWINCLTPEARHTLFSPLVRFYRVLYLVILCPTYHSY